MSGLRDRIVAVLTDFSMRPSEAMWCADALITDLGLRQETIPATKTNPQSTRYVTDWRAMPVPKTLPEQLDAAQTGEEFGNVLMGFFAAFDAARYPDPEPDDA